MSHQILSFRRILKFRLLPFVHHKDTKTQSILFLKFFLCVLVFLVSWCLGGKNSVLKQPRPKVSQNIILINTTKTLTHKDAKHSFFKVFFFVSWCLGGKNSVLKQPHPKVSQNIILINTTKRLTHKDAKHSRRCWCFQKVCQRFS